MASIYADLGIVVDKPSHNDIIWPKKIVEEAIKEIKPDLQKERFLVYHNSFELEDIIGVVEDIRIEDDGRVKAFIRYLDTPKTKIVIQISPDLCNYCLRASGKLSAPYRDPADMSPKPYRNVTEMKIDGMVLKLKKPKAADATTNSL